ncbi:MAG: hypothetical protein K2X74_18525 [Acetobacteraceae bacterium]|nr:hypothetical protein [Acetobacteraceae bacterium]
MVQRGPRLRQHPWRDRRGAVAAVLAVSGTALIGMLALGAEVGVWQMQQRAAQSAADLAALSGVLAMEAGGNAAAVATDAAGRNGFVQGGENGRTTVVVNRPPLAGAYAGRADAVEVVVRQVQNLGMARVAIGAAPTVQGRAVALNSVDVSACILALDGGLSLGGNSTTNARRCALAANSVSRGINIFGSARVRASDLVTTGPCTGCASGDVWTDDTRTARPATTANRPTPVPDPYQALQRWTPAPPACRPGGVQFTRRAATISPGEGAICSNLSISPNETLTLNPGIYYFNNASLDIRGTVTGNGVTIVMTGNAATVGTIQINAQSNVTLSAPTTSLVPGVPEGKGVVLYRDGRASNNGPQNEVRLNGGASMRLIGAIYLPTSDVQVNGNSGANYSSCMPIVGYALSFSGTADTWVDVSECGTTTPVPQLRTARLVE